MKKCTLYALKKEPRRTAKAKLFTACEDGKDFPPPQGTKRRMSWRVWHGLILPTISLMTWLLNWSATTMEIISTIRKIRPCQLNLVIKKYINIA